MSKLGHDNDDSPKVQPFVTSTLIVGMALILGSFIAPWLFTQNSFLPAFNFTETGEIGDTIGGLMNPIVGIAGVFMTFMAFYIQVRANQMQYKIFRQEINTQKHQNRREEVERQFYSMLELHKQNLNDVIVTTYAEKSESQNGELVATDISGRRAFEQMKLEFEAIYLIARKHFENIETKKVINEAFGVFFHGLKKKNIKVHSFFAELYKVGSTQEFYGFDETWSVLAMYQIGWDKENVRLPLATGHSDQLAHYYRHLFQTVKYIAQQPDELLSYEDKRRYLRLLRAQLSNSEQALLFYNYSSNFGVAWNSPENRFLTDYRMIHNIYPALLVEGILLEDFFPELENPETVRKEKGRSQDPLFEFEDWNVEHNSKD